MLPGAIFKVQTCGCEAFDLYTNGVRFVELVEHATSPQRSPRLEAQLQDRQPSTITMEQLATLSMSRAA